MVCFRLSRSLLLAVVLGIALGFTLSSTQPMAQEIAPRQSTSGPVPPPSVLEKNAMRMVPPAPGGVSRTISGVPGYAWRHGCGPTAVGMVMGFYDGAGFGDLFPGLSTTQTGDVNQAIASQGSGTRGSGLQKHYEDYCLPMDSGQPSVAPDSSENYPNGCHADDSIADYMHTSWSADSNYYGWSWSNRIIPAFSSYMEMKNPDYVYAALQYRMSSGSLSWNVLTTEISNDRPMVFLVDTDGDEATDHFVTVVGYSDGPPQQYACLDTWSPYDQVRWCEFRGMGSGIAWGIWGGWSFQLQYSLSVEAVNGSVTRQPMQIGYDPGASVTLTATADSGYQFAGWSGNVPAGQEQSNPLDLLMDGNKTLTALFQSQLPAAVEDWGCYK